MQVQSALIKEQTCDLFSQVHRGISLSCYYLSLSILANSSATALLCTATLYKYCYYCVHDYALAFAWILVQRELQTLAHGII